MNAITKKLPENEKTPEAVDVYLGFEILRHGDDGFIAIPRGWTHTEVRVLEADDLPALRKQIWKWWHSLLD
jgi:hypothetical protein